MLLACAKLRFLREQPAAFFFCGEPCIGLMNCQRQKQWTNIKAILVQHLVCAGVVAA